MKKIFAIAAVAGLMSLAACDKKPATDAGNTDTTNLAAPADNFATDNTATVDNSIAPAAGNAAGPDVAPVATDNSAAPAAGNSVAPAGEKEKHHKAK